MDIIKHFENIIKPIESPIVIEIGANNGHHTNLMCSKLKALNKNYKFFAFEPDHRRIPEFQSLNKNNNVIFEPIAIGNTEGSIDFNLSGGEQLVNNKVSYFTGSSSIKNPKICLTAWPTMTFEKTSVKISTLENIVTKYSIPKIDFIWMDVQGAEEEVLLGAKNILNRVRYIYTEYCNVELYENEFTLKDILRTLPMFSVVENYGGDVLLKSEEFKL